MKFMGTLPVMVIVLHTQCLASCYAAGDTSPVATRTTPVPPCHGQHQESGAPSRDHPADHDDNACGFASVTPSKSMLMLESEFQLARLPAVVPSAVLEAEAVDLVRPGSPPSPGFLAALELKLRI
jgi:hypothetical protein